MRDRYHLDYVKFYDLCKIHNLYIFPVKQVINMFSGFKNRDDLKDKDDKDIYNEIYNDLEKNLLNIKKYSDISNHLNSIRNENIEWIVSY